MSLLRSITRKLMGNGCDVNIVVHVPEETPPGEKVFVSGACQELGEWRAAGKALRQTDRGTWEARVCLPKGQGLEFKVTRGSWDAVEKHADGSDTGNHIVSPEDLSGQSICHTVERWSDVA